MQELGWFSRGIICNYIYIFIYSIGYILYITYVHLYIYRLHTIQLYLPTFSNCQNYRDVEQTGNCQRSRMFDVTIKDSTGKTFVEME